MRRSSRCLPKFNNILATNSSAAEYFSIREWQCKSLNGCMKPSNKISKQKILPNSKKIFCPIPAERIGLMEHNLIYAPLTHLANTVHNGIERISNMNFFDAWNIQEPVHSHLYTKGYQHRWSDDYGLNTANDESFFQQV